MLTSGEIAAMDVALERYRAWTDELKVAAEHAPVLSVEFDEVADTMDRPHRIYRTSLENLDRFSSRRNELAAGDDHEAVLAFVEGINHIVGSGLPQTVEEWNKAANVLTIAKESVKDALLPAGAGIVAFVLFFVVVALLIVRGRR